MKKFEVFLELPKYDTETQNEQMLLEKMTAGRLGWTQGCHKSAICKIHNI